MAAAWALVICLLVVVSLFVLLFTVCDNGVAFGFVTSLILMLLLLFYVVVADCGLL